jgi:hypothetical protein
VKYKYRQRVTLSDSDSNAPAMSEPVLDTDVATAVSSQRGPCRKRAATPPSSQPDADDPYWQEAGSGAGEDDSSSKKPCRRDMEEHESYSVLEYDPRTDPMLPHPTLHSTLICWTNRDTVIFFIVPDRVLPGEVRQDLYFINNYYCHDNADKNSAVEETRKKWEALYRIGALLEEGCEDGGLREYRCPEGALILNSFVTFIYSCGYSARCAALPPT